MSDYLDLAALIGLATGDPTAAADITSGVQMSRKRATDGRDPRVVSIPAAFNPDALVALGFELIGEAPDRDAHRAKYQQVRMPEGWTIETGEDPRIKDIRDERGVKRVTTEDVGQFWDPYATTSVVRQGYEVPLRLCYGDDKRSTLEYVRWEKLTEAERAEAIEGLRGFAERDGAYADSAKRAQEWLERLT